MQDTTEKHKPERAVWCPRETAEASQKLGSYADTRIGDLDYSDDTHLHAVQAPGSSSCQAPATRSQHHAHKGTIPGNMESYSKDANAEHDVVKEVWKQPC
jgi:hypothetical protein